MPLEISHKPAVRGPYLKLALTFKKKCLRGPIQSEIGFGQYKIDDLVDIRLQFEQTVPTSDDTIDARAPLPLIIKISTRKCERGKDLTVKLKVTSPKFNCSQLIVCSDAWTDLVEIGRSECVFKDSLYVLEDVEVSFIVSKTGSVTFANLYNDVDIIDFNLSLEDSSVPVHKACLAAHSNKFKTMLTTVWKNVKDGRIQVDGVTPHTLRYLKDYMYLGTLPDVELRPMLLFAIHYSMENLKSACITKLVEMVEFSNLYDLLEFACKNNIPELAFALLLQTSDEVVHSAYEIRRNALGEDRRKRDSNF